MYNDAKNFANKYSNPHVYSRPYNSLTCGELIVDELNMEMSGEEEMWWLDDSLEDDYF